MFSMNLRRVSAIPTIMAAGMALMVAQAANAQSRPDGLVVVKSAHSFDETLRKLEASLTSKTQTIFAKFDHRQNASGVGLELRPTTVVVFGNPKGGTPLMQAQQSIAIDLPMKFLVSQDAAGTVSISYNDPEWLGRRHGLPDASSGALKAISQFLAENAKAAAK